MQVQKPVQELGLQIFVQANPIIITKRGLIVTEQAKKAEANIHQQMVEQQKV
jgi:hypothetical protein